MASSRRTTETERRLQEIVGRKLRVPADEIPLDSDLLEDLDLDSLDVVAVIVEIEGAFAPVRISEGKGEELRTLREVAAFVDQELELR